MQRKVLAVMASCMVFLIIGASAFAGGQGEAVKESNRVTAYTTLDLNRNTKKLRKNGALRKIGINSFFFEMFFLAHLTAVTEGNPCGATKVL